MEPLVIPRSETPIDQGAVAALRRARAARLAERLGAYAPPSRSTSVLRSLERLAHAAPGDFTDLLSDPSIGVLLDTGRERAAYAVLGFELACQRALLDRLDLPPTRLWSVCHALLFEPSREAAGIALQSGTLLVQSGAGTASAFALKPQQLAECSLGRLSSPFRDVRGSVRFGLFDPNPLSRLEAHPDKQGNSLSLGGRPVEAWLEGLGAATSIVEDYLPELWPEMQLLLRLILPTGSHDEKQLSASYREYIGAVYLTLHPNVFSTVEALVHEFQHNKLNLVLQQHELLENADAPLYRSPIRPDLRPLSGILLAAHAFVPIAELYRRLVERRPAASGPVQRLSELVGKNDEALRTLGQHARWTPVGARIHEELLAWHTQHLSLGLSVVQGVTHHA